MFESERWAGLAMIYGGVPSYFECTTEGLIDRLRGGHNSISNVTEARSGEFNAEK